MCSLRWFMASGICGSGDSHFALSWLSLPYLLDADCCLLRMCLFSFCVTRWACLTICLLMNSKSSCRLEETRLLFSDGVSETKDLGRGPTLRPEGLYQDLRVMRGRLMKFVSKSGWM